MNARLTRAEQTYLRSLRQKKHRAAEPVFLMEGLRVVSEALNAKADIDYVVLVPERVGDAELLKTLARHGVLIKETGANDFDALADTVHAQGILAVVRKPRHDLASTLQGKGELLVALDAVGDPGNLGSILRTCDWFGVAGVWLGQGCVDLFNDKVVRATAGSLLHLPIVQDVDLLQAIQQAKRAGYRITATAGDGDVALPKLRRGVRTLVIFGSEAHGISSEIRACADVAVSVPSFGGVESLNVAVTCGIVLAHLKLDGR